MGFQQMVARQRQLGRTLVTKQNCSDAYLPLLTFGAPYRLSGVGGATEMGLVSRQSHVPYAIRYVARLQERAARSLQDEGKSPEDMARKAWKLRVAASLISQGVPLARS